ncbi:MAG: radical SAM family heme chaperone HemW [Acidobacteria bacterium]|nr:radical SAM family heme chaperone HemW [Acidobacteriota bacterium]
MANPKPIQTTPTPRHTVSERKLQTPSGAGIYLSVPYCRQKCTYCNFASAVRPIAELPRYLNALQWEILRCRELWEEAGLPPQLPVAADSIYLGGGTPGLLNPAQLASLLHAVRTTFEIHREAEITLEASPENVTVENAAAWSSIGINRVSLGVQSMIMKELRAVGRTHTAARVAEAVVNLRSSGIDNISVDLIAGLPHQTAESWNATLQAVVDLEPTHLSVYMLEVDQDSSLGGELLRGGNRYGASVVPSDELVVELYTRAVERLADAGFLHYEISNFARPGGSSRHNEKYWMNIPYFGFGVDAHSFDGEHRWANVDSIASYLERRDQGLHPIQERKKLEPAEKLAERFFLGLRRRQGISLPMIESEFGDSFPEELRETIREYCDGGWLETAEGWLRLTDQGVLFSNEVFAGLLAGEAATGTGV